MAALHRLKQAGYMIALDDFTIDDPRTPLTDFANTLKVDLRQNTLEQGAAIAKRYGPWRCRMLAEKVESREEFVAAKAAGFVYFQGYFFRRPEVLQNKEIPANQLNYVRLLQAVSQPELQLRELENLIKTESVRLLSAAALSEFGSIRHSERSAFHSSRLDSSRRARSPAMDTLGRYPDRW